MICRALCPSVSDTEGAFPGCGCTNSGSDDIFVVKLAPNGDPIWTMQFGTAEQDWGRAVAVDADNNVFVTGATSGGLNGQSYNGGIDIFVAKLSPQGNEIWTRLLGGRRQDQGAHCYFSSNNDLPRSPAPEHTPTPFWGA